MNYMIEQKGRHEEDDFHARQLEAAEFNRLGEKARLLRRQLEMGEHTDAPKLDQLLTSEVAYRQYRVDHPRLYYVPRLREKDGEQILKYQKILGGTYQKAKSEYCLEEGLGQKNSADDQEKHSQEEDASISQNERDESAKIAEQRRMIAANWLRTAANCLTMSEARPPVPEQTE